MVSQPLISATPCPQADAVPRISNHLWPRLAALISASDPPTGRGRHRTEPRAVLDAILYRLITGCAWHQLPSSFPHSSSVYRTYQRWKRSGLLEELLRLILANRAPLRDQPAGARTGGALSVMPPNGPRPLHATPLL